MTHDRWIRLNLAFAGKTLKFDSGDEMWGIIWPKIRCIHKNGDVEFWVQELSVWDRHYSELTLQIGPFEIAMKDAVEAIR